MSRKHKPIAVGKPGLRIGENELSMDRISSAFNYSATTDLTEAIRKAMGHYPEAKGKFGERVGNTILKHSQEYVWAIDRDLLRRMAEDGHLEVLDTSPDSPNSDTNRYLVAQILGKSFLELQDRSRESAQIR